MLFQELFSSCCGFWTGGLFIFSPSLNVPAADETTQCFCVSTAVLDQYIDFFARPTQGYIQHPHGSLSSPIMVCNHTSICLAFHFGNKYDPSAIGCHFTCRFGYITSPCFYNLECTSIHFATGYKLSGNSPAGQNGGSCCCYLQVEWVRVRAHDTHKPLKILPPVKIIASFIMVAGPSVFSLGIAPNFCPSQPSFCYTKAELDTRQHMLLAMPGHMRKFRG